MSEPQNLIDAARSHSVGVIGGGIGGLVLAWACAKVGIRVTVWQAGQTGGTMRTVDLDGSRVDVGADQLTVSDGVESVLSAFGLTNKLVAPAVTDRFVNLPTPIRLPDSAAWGVPANPFAPEVTAVIGKRAAWRAYLDRLKPVLTIGNADTLGPLVRKRLGAAVCDKLVAPRTRAELGLEPNDVVIDVASPELNGSFTRAGSLTGGVAMLEDVMGARALEGGTSTLIDALCTRISELGGTIITDTVVDSLTQNESTWTLSLTTAEGESEASVEHVVVATDDRSATRLLRSLLPQLPEPASRDVTMVTLAVDGISADAPLGAGLYAAHANENIAVIDHQSARWPSLTSAAHHAIMRVHLNGAFDDEEAVALATAEIGRTYTGAGDISASRVDHFYVAQSQSAVTWNARTQRVRAAVSKAERLEIVGAWVAGYEIADVIDDALSTAEKIRRTALFPESDMDA